MADRDIPSVPVTTLAGLASLSDLLSELPISESSVITSLNKSLLFHPRVAEEANNLLSIKDDNLTRQLVQAIEQTNSDHIELKSQYAEQPSSGTNINELPQLLQAIHTLKPTVFKSGTQQQQRQIFQPQLLHRNLAQQNPLQQNQLPAGNGNQLWNPQTYQSSNHPPIGATNTLNVVHQQQTINAHQQQQSFDNENQNYPNQQQNYAFGNTTINNTVQSQQHHQQQRPPDQQHNAINPQQQKYQSMPMPIKNEIIIKEEYQTPIPVPYGTKIQSPVIHQTGVIQQPQQQQQRYLQPNDLINSQQVAAAATGAVSVVQTMVAGQSTVNVLQQNMQNTNQNLIQQQPIAAAKQTLAHNIVSVLPNQQHHQLQQKPQQQQLLQQQQQHHQQLQHQQQFPTQQIPSTQQLQSHHIQQQQNQHHQLPIQQPYQQQQFPMQPQIALSHQQQQQQRPTIQQYQQQPHQLPMQQQYIQPLIKQQQPAATQPINQPQTQQISTHNPSTPSRLITTNVIQKIPPNLSPQSKISVTPAQNTNIIRGNNTTSIVGVVSHDIDNPVPPQKMIPRNSEYLEKLNKNTDIRGGPSPAQASDAPESNQMSIQQQRTTNSNILPRIANNNNTKGPAPPQPSTIQIQASTITAAFNDQKYQHHQQSGFSVTTTQLATTTTTLSTANTTIATNTSTSQYTTAHLIPEQQQPNCLQYSSRTSSAERDSKSKIKIKLFRLKDEHIKIMQESITGFTQKSPDIAIKLGLKTMTGVAEVPDNADDFSKIKAMERRGLKRSYNNITSNQSEEKIQFAQPKLRRITLKNQSSKVVTEDVTKTQTYQQFIRNMENELRRLEETEQPSNIDDLDYSDCIPSKVLAQLSNDVAKLKAKGAVNAVPKNKLTLLINFAMRNIDVAKSSSAGPDMEDDFDDVIDKILDAAEACLLVSNIYATTDDVKFLQEDNMDKIIKFVQLQVRETIFPSYDPVYSIVKNVKKTDSRKKKSSGGLSRGVQLLFTKLVELMKIFVTLFDHCSFVDTIVLAVATLAVEPFFIDNIDTLQFAALELVTTIFRKENYSNYRSSILNDILTSIDRLPYSKKNLRPYKLVNNGGCIQMVTALILQLIQCSTVLPESFTMKNVKNNKRKSVDAELKFDSDLVIFEKCETAYSIGGNFLKTFLSKCKSRTAETDFRPLFENFVHDLLTTVNKPEWPASELLLSLLGTMLVKYMSDKNIEQSIRVVSLDYLGIVSARLRKDTVESRCKVNTMDALIKCIKLEQEKEGDKDSLESKIVMDPEEERTEFLQKILLDFLAVNAQEDNLIWDYARYFYLTQWYKDVIKKKKSIAEGEKGYASRKKSPKKGHKFNKSESDTSQDEESTSSDYDVDGTNDDTNVNAKKGSSKTQKKTKTNNPNLPDQELNLEIFRMLENRKKYFLSKVTPCSTATITTDNASIQDIKTYIDYSNAQLIAQYLASKRPFSQSFDRYLQKIICVVQEPSIAIRTKAIKCLAMIVEVDPSILLRKDMQMGVNQKFLDTSISVREAAVDLIGKYVLNSPDLIDQYYDMLSTRILDTGVSVRKRVIKILRDICIEYPDFDKIPEICVKMIRRVNDEEGIQKLVTEVFMRMWFTPCAENDAVSIERKINQISDVVSMAHDTGTQWLDGLLKGVFTPKEDKDNAAAERIPNAPKKEPPKDVVKACQQLADGLVNAIIRYEGNDNKKAVSCVTTLNLFAKVRPLLLVKHAITLEPYLNIKGNIHHIMKIISLVAEILEQVVPLMEHPSESFLADLETHLMVLVCSHNQSVVNSCLSCLGAVVNRITKNFKLIRDCFLKYYKPILINRNLLESEPSYPIENIFKPIFRRGLYTIGLIFRFFDFKAPEVYGDGLGSDASELPPTICDEIFDHLIFFARLPNNEIRRETLIALGPFCIRNFEYLTNQRLRNYYCDLLMSPEYSIEIKINVLRNIIMYLHDADQSMEVKEKDWKTQSLVENLGDMGDVISGMSSRIIQLYLRDVLNSLMHPNFNVRLWSMKVVQAVLRQGLVHPVQIVPYLICLSTDTRKEIAHRADHHLQEIDKKYPGFVNMKCHVGIRLSFEMQTILQIDDVNTKMVRGYCMREKDEQPTALNGFLYTLLRNTKPQRRALVQSITKQFDETKTTLRHMLYLADNLAYFPYLVQDEPLYIIHQIDLVISCTGTGILQTFKENLIPLQKPRNPDPDNRLDVLEDDDDDEDRDAILARLPENTIELQKCIISAQGCILLLLLKQHLKSSYKMTEGKISRYSPSEPAKIYEKPLHRQGVEKFNPKSILNIILEQNDTGQQPLSDNSKKDLIDRYLEFKQLMLKFEKEESDNDSDKAIAKTVTNTPNKSKSTTSTTTSNATTIDLTTADNEIHVNNVNNVIPHNTTSVPNKENYSTTLPPPSSTTQTPTTINQKMVVGRTTIKQPSHAHVRKQPARSKRKKRRVMSSSDDSDYSDEDY